MATFDHRQIAMAPYRDIDLAKLRRIVGVRNPCIPINPGVAINRHECFYDTSDLLLELLSKGRCGGDKRVAQWRATFEGAISPRT